MEETNTPPEDSLHRAPPVQSTTEVQFAKTKTPFPFVSGDRCYHVFYSDELARRILDLYISGESLHKIAQMEGMPSYGTLLKWAHNLPQFRDEYKTARLARAIHLEEEALRVASEIDDSEDKDRASVARVKFEILKWGAEVSDSAQYGRKTTISGDAGRPIVFQIVTGVPEPEGKEVLLDKTGIVQDAVETTGEIISELEEYAT